MPVTVVPIPPLDATMKPRNRYKVPKKQWDKWADLARSVFNNTFHCMTENPEFYRHPQTAAIPTKQWSTTAWNAAWIAANNVQGTLMAWSNDAK